MTKYEQQKHYLIENGFKYNPIHNGYTKEVRKDNNVLGIILVRDLGTLLLNPIFRASGQIYLGLPTLDYLGDLLDKYDRALTRIELGY